MNGIKIVGKIQKMSNEIHRLTPVVHFVVCSPKIATILSHYPM